MSAAEVESINFFEREVIAHARTMSVGDARQFLRGLLAVTEADRLDGVRRAFNSLVVADEQLELIARGARSAQRS